MKKSILLSLFVIALFTLLSTGCASLSPSKPVAVVSTNTTVVVATGGGVAPLTVAKVEATVVTGTGIVATVLQDIANGLKAISKGLASVLTGGN
jgi:hypothetical protein